MPRRSSSIASTRVSLSWAARYRICRYCRLAPAACGGAQRVHRRCGNGSGKQIVAIAILAKAPGLRTSQSMMWRYWIRWRPLPRSPRETVYPALRIVDLQAFGIQVHAHHLADQATVHRVGVGTHADGAVTTHPAIQAGVVVHPSRRYGRRSGCSSAGAAGAGMGCVTMPSRKAASAAWSSKSRWPRSIRA